MTSQALNMALLKILPLQKACKIGLKSMEEQSLFPFAASEYMCEVLEPKDDE
jgi:hypothetical protein